MDRFDTSNPRGTNACINSISVLLPHLFTGDSTARIGDVFQAGIRKAWRHHSAIASTAPAGNTMYFLSSAATLLSTRAPSTASAQGSTSARNGTSEAAASDLAPMAESTSRPASRSPRSFRNDTSLERTADTRRASAPRSAACTLRSTGSIWEASTGLARSSPPQSSSNSSTVAGWAGTASSISLNSAASSWTAR